MKQDVTLKDFRALAEFRYLLRGYLNGTDQACRRAGLEPLHYYVLLQLVGLPSNQPPTISFVAKRLFLRHHSAVELVDRMERRKLVRRVRGVADRRVVEVHVTPRAKARLRRLVNHRMQEIRVLGPEFARAIETFFQHSRGGDSARLVAD
jgi:DNA-binding MarR family transcriptional regulator